MTIAEKVSAFKALLKHYHQAQKKEGVVISAEVLSVSGLNLRELKEVICPNLVAEGFLRSFTLNPASPLMIEEVADTFIFHSEIIPSFEFTVYKDRLKENLNETKDKIKLARRSIKFEDAEAHILIGETSVALPPFQNEHCLCRVVFKRKIHEPVDWSLIYKEMTGDSEEVADKKKMRTVQDAMYGLNDRIKKELDTDDNLLSWKNKSISRNF